MIGIQDTSSPTYRAIMGNGLTYEIPKFQRDYSWELEQWDDLWQDIESVLKGQEPAHYLGYLVLQTGDNKNYKVIDGQQRLTTLSIIVLAVLKCLKKLEEQKNDSENNRIRRESLLNSYIGYLNPVTLIADNKLKLNRNNDKFYRQRLVTLDKLPQRGLNVSEKLMKQCFEWYERKLTEKYKTGEDLAGFVDNIVDKLFFTLITVTDELNAFKVFETLNARGVQLSSADLLKNYLFSVVDKKGSHDTEIHELELLWSQVLAKLGNEKFPEFLRIYWNSRNKTTRKNDLFKTIRGSINSKAEVFQLLRDLDDKADLYSALLNPDDEFWIGRNKLVEYIRELKLFGVKQPLSLLLTAYEKLDEEKFEKMLRIISILSFRYNVIGSLNANDQEKVYNTIAMKMHGGSGFSTNDFNQIYPSDDEFTTAFSNKEFKPTSRNNQVVRYIFGRLESFVCQHEIEYESERYTIEHILPESPSEEWNISEDAYERCVYRLGNLCILEKNLNQKIENKVYSIKKPVLEKSSVKLTIRIAEENSEWNEDKISKRQSWLAKQAKSIWVIN